MQIEDGPAMIERFLESLPDDLRSDPTILDVGSHTGEQSCEFAVRFPRGRVFAFEALPSSAAVLRNRVRDFANISVIEAAVCDIDGSVTFHAVVEGNAGASSLFLASGHNDVAPIRQAPIIVQAIRLDTWAQAAGMETIDVVWMDLQGAELLALRGMGDLLSTVRAIQLEVTYRELYSGQVMWPQARGFLETHGMQLVDQWPDVSGYFGDAVFVRT